MRQASELFQELNSLDEGQHLEAKTSGEQGQSILETICAFANKEGGHILCGVKKDPQRLFGYIVQGIANPDKLMCDIQSAVQDAFSSRVRIDVDREEIDKQAVVVVQVYPNADHSIVFFRKGGLPKGAYERRGSSDYQFRFDDMPTLLSRIPSVHQNAETDIAIDSLDHSLIRDYRSAREKVRGTDNADMPEREFLEMLGFAHERNGATYATSAGVIFLGTDAAIRKLVPSSRVFIARMPKREESSCPGQEPLDVTYNFEGSAFSYTEKAIKYLLDALPSRSTYSADSNARDDLTVVRRRIAREIVVNAVAHRDFLQSSCVEILHYSNRIEVRNPGTSRVPVERLGDGVSDARNPLIVKAFQDVNWAESRGTGIGTVRRKMEALGLLEPLFDNDISCNRFVATLITVSVPETLKVAFGLALTTAQLKIMFATLEIGRVSISMLQSLLQSSELIVSTTVEPLLTRALLCKTRSNRGVEFVAGPASLAVQAWLIQGANPGVVPTNASKLLAVILQTMASQACDVIRACQKNGESISVLSTRLRLQPIQVRTEILPKLLAAGFVSPVVSPSGEMSYVTQPIGDEFLRLQSLTESTLVSKP